MRFRRPSKYRAQPTIVDGIRFQSKREANRYTELKLCEKAGRIKRLELQKWFPIDVNGVHICHYVADFVYFDGHLKVIEDCKGYRTPEYKLKKKLFEALYGLPILET